MNGQGIVPVDGELHEAVETVDFPEGGFRGWTTVVGASVAFLSN